ncbi:hypothetical protein BDW59DRAFT_166296 [Aspergillus cavernicola]|uniref:Six-hairpin glycosidase-like protein n=1 Tax=Aspergillus cavernicola TaxID=176166 RepID=A0ABR4HM70_9EURO
MAVKLRMQYYYYSIVIVLARVQINASQGESSQYQLDGDKRLTDASRAIINLTWYIDVEPYMPIWSVPLEQASLNTFHLLQLLIQPLQKSTNNQGNYQGRENTNISLWIVDLIAHLPKSWQDWILPPASIPIVTNHPSKIQLSRIAHVYFEHRDLNRFNQFAEDFGFVQVERRGNTVYYGGYGRDPYIYVASQSTTGQSWFLAGAWVALDRDNFNKASELAGAICEDLEQYSRGSTFFHVVYGQIERAVETEISPNLRLPPLLATHKSQGLYNGPFEKPCKGQFQRYCTGPVLVHKLGHYGYVCRE